MFWNKPKPQPPHKHYWIKEMRTWNYSKENKPSWRCRDCREWEEDIKKNKIKTNERSKLES
jgi:hypothetical protein